MAFSIPVSECPLWRDPPFVFGLVWLGTGIGHRALRLLHAKTEAVRRLEHGVLAAALGLGLLQFLPYTLGMLGLLTPANLGVGLLLLAALFARDMLRVARGVTRAVSQHTKIRTRPDGWSFAFFVLLPLPLALAFLQALCPPTDNDGLSYHLVAPKRWLGTGFLDYLPTLAHTNAPMGVEMLFTLPMALWSDTAAKLVHYALGLLALCAVYAFGRRLHSGRTGLMAACLFALATPQVLSEYSAAYVDLGITFAVVSAFLGWLLWHRTKGAGGWLMASALCAGLGASFKLTGAFYGVVIALLVWRDMRENEILRRNALPTAARFFLVSLLPLLPWLWRSWRLTGNPVWPLLPRLFPTRDWNLTADKYFTLWFRYYNWGGTRLANWSMGRRQMLLLLVVVGVVFGAAILARRARDREIAALITGIAALMVFAVASVGIYFRFYLPILPLLYCVLLTLLTRESAPLRKFVPALILLPVAFLALLGLRKTPLPLGTAIPAATGSFPRHAFLMQHHPLLPLWEYANKNLPPDAPLLLAGFRPAFAGLTGGVAYYCQHPCYVTDAYTQQSFRMEDWSQYRYDVARYHIRYVAVPNTKNAEYDPLNYSAAQNELPFAHRLADVYGHLLFDNGDVSLYRLDGIQVNP